MHRVPGLDLPGLRLRELRAVGAYRSMAPAPRPAPTAPQKQGAISADAGMSDRKFLKGEELYGVDGRYADGYGHWAMSVLTTN